MTRTLPLRRRAATSLVATVALALGVAAAPAPALISHPGTNSGQASSPPTAVHKSSFNGGLAGGSIPKADRIAAARAATHNSASLDRFALIHVRTIPPAATLGLTNSPDPEGFQFGDAAIGAAGGVALSMLVLGGALVASRRHTRRSESVTA